MQLPSVVAPFFTIIARPRDGIGSLKPVDSQQSLQRCQTKYRLMGKML